MPNLQLIKQLLLKMVGEKSCADLDILKEPTPSHDAGDAASMVGQKEAAAFIADGQRLKVVQARVALDRIKEGTYGTCLACDGKISEARLNAVPQTPFCVTCQEKLDRNDLPDFAYLAAPRQTPVRINFAQ